MSFWEVIQKRPIIKVSAVYALVGSIVIQIASITFDPLQLPIWMFTFLIIVVLLGFPVALILAWSFDPPSGKISGIDALDDLTLQSHTEENVRLKPAGHLAHRKNNPVSQGATSIIPGYDCDVFISFEKKDDQYDGWVTGFADRLTMELMATVKEPLNVYFGEDLSLRKSMNSLIVIPVISQTYCNARSEVWKNEFLYFKSAFEKDVFGGIIELKNGNFVNRILPVKIHDLEDEDLQLLENELKGKLRSIDFTYKEKGVNRPLREKDDDILLGKYQVLYRNQINKVANSVKDLIHALKEQHQRMKPAAVGNLPGGQQTGADLNAPSIFLAWTSADLKTKRDEISMMLERAGFIVLPFTDCPSDDEQFRTVVDEYITKADYSLHLVSGEFGRRFEIDDLVSHPQYQYQIARRKSDGINSNFQVFIWYVQDESSEVKPLQKAFISDLRRNLSSKMMFSNVSNSYQLVENIRAIANTREDIKEQLKEIEILFIHCEDDELEAMSLTDNIGDEIPLETLNILFGSEEKFKDLSKDQIAKSRLAVIYFKYGGDWAIPFTKQLWKELGGAESPTQMFLIGEDDPKANLSRKFKAPKVKCEILPRNLIPGQIKLTLRNIPSGA